MDENKFKKNKFKSPEMNQRKLYNTQRINHYPLQDDTSDLYEDIIDTNINNQNIYNNLKQIQIYKSEYDKNNLYNFDQEDDFSSDINNFFMNLNTNVSLMKSENTTLKNDIKKYRKKLLSKDKEIDNYKQKVRALLNQVQDKNYDLGVKRNTIIKLSEEKEMINMNQSPSNKSLNEIYTLKIQSQKLYTEKEQYKKQIIYLKNLIQKMNKNNIKQNKINNNNINNSNNNKNKNIESEKSSEYNEVNKNKIINLKNNYYNNKKNDLVISSFVMQIKGIPTNYENNDYIELINEKDFEFSKLQKEFEEFKKRKELELIKLNKEKEEKNDLLKKREKLLNDYIANIKSIKEENNNLKNNLNKRMVELNEYKLKYDDDKNNDTGDKKIEMDLITRENKELKEKINSIEEEKINNERKIEELNEDIENLKENNDNLKKKLDEKNNKINKLNDDINTLKEQIKENEDINKENLSLKQKEDEMKQELENLQNQNEQLINDKNDLSKKIQSLENNYNITKKELNDIKLLNTELIEKMSKNKTSEEKENEKESNMVNKESNNDNKIIDENEIKKENEVLQQRVIQLNNLIEELNTQSNELNVKYANIKKENANLKEASKALLEKQKNEMEQKDKLEKISPETHYIITKKTYNKLIWYLISIINPNDKSQNKNIQYENFRWVTEKSIPKNQLNKFNKFEDDETKIDDLYSYIKKMQNKLEEKEEEINKKNYENQKLNNKLQNKSSNIKVGKLFLTKMLNNDKNNKSNNANKSNSNQNTLKNNANSYLGGNKGDDMEKYKNLLDKLNDYDEREKKFQNEISKLKTQLKNKENLQSNTKDINVIPFDSDFIGDDLEDKKVIDLIPNENAMKKKEKAKNKDDDDNFLNILNDVPDGDSDSDGVKGLKELVAFLKKSIRDKDKIINDLLKQIQEIIKDLKWSVKNNKIVTQILTILGYTPEVIKIVTENKKGFNFDFNLELKK